MGDTGLFRFLISGTGADDDADGYRMNVRYAGRYYPEPVVQCGLLVQVASLTCSF
jgi:hypothetical protein